MLTDDPHLNAVEIEVVVKDGEVTLSGTVDSRGARRHAEDLAEQASGVKHVQNNLRVDDGRRENAGSGRSPATRDKGATH
jgi:osmotically-inducible protein OsmY